MRVLCISPVRLWLLDAAAKSWLECSKVELIQEMIDGVTTEFMEYVAFITLTACIAVSINASNDQSLSSLSKYLLFQFLIMFLLKRVTGLRMFGFAFGPGDKDDDGDKENQPDSPKSTPPWTKRPKVEVKETQHSNLVKSIRYGLLCQKT